MRAPDTSQKIGGLIRPKKRVIAAFDFYFRKKTFVSGSPRNVSCGGQLDFRGRVTTNRRGKPAWDVLSPNSTSSNLLVSEAHAVALVRLLVINPSMRTKLLS